MANYIISDWLYFIGFYNLLHIGYQNIDKSHIGTSLAILFYLSPHATHVCHPLECSFFGPCIRKPIEADNWLWWLVNEALLKCLCRNTESW